MVLKDWERWVEIIREINSLLPWAHVMRLFFCAAQNATAPSTHAPPPTPTFLGGLGLQKLNISWLIFIWIFDSHRKG